jgi:hypothetical protein
MPCTEGKRLSAQFLQSVMVMRDLEKQSAPTTTAAKRARMQEMDRARQYHDSCKREVIEHARWCPTCRPANK